MTKTKSDIITSGVKDLLDSVNKNICNINKKARTSKNGNIYHTSLELITTQDIINTARKSKKLEEALYIIGYYHDKFVQQAYSDYNTRNSDRHPSELQPDKSSAKKHQDRLQQEYDSMKKELAATRRKLTIALKKLDK